MLAEGEDFLNHAFVPVFQHGCSRPIGLVISLVERQRPSAVATD
jgi:hypothetical protein